MKAFRYFFVLVFSATALLWLDSCRKTSVSTPTPLPFEVPAGFPATAIDMRGLPLTEEGFLLGRKLFYDGRLSKDGHFACSSCHQQIAAFTTFEHDRSHGYNNSHTLRNAPALANLAWNPAYNWDGSETSLASLIQKHITTTTEMGETVENVLGKLQADTAYRRLFRSTYRDEKITADRMYNALSQFVLSLVSANSKYDRVKKGQSVFSAEEDRGYALFQQKCNNCHTEPLFTDYSYRNIGLEVDPMLQDYGRMRVTGNRADSLKFRVPSLRNVEMTSYYTHDGRMSMMRMMIQHYRFGVVQSATLDPLLTNGIQLTDAEENDLVAFLRTLSDSTFINSPRFRE